MTPQEAHTVLYSKQACIPKSGTQACCIVPSRFRSMGFLVKTPPAQARGVFPRYLPSRFRSMGFVVKTPPAQARGSLSSLFTISLPLDGFCRQDSSCASAGSLSSLFTTFISAPAPESQESGAAGQNGSNSSRAETFSGPRLYWPLLDSCQSPSPTS